MKGFEKNGYIDLSVAVAIIFKVTDRSKLDNWLTFQN